MAGAGTSSHNRKKLHVLSYVRETKVVMQQVNKMEMDYQRGGVIWKGGQQGISSVTSMTHRIVRAYCGTCPSSFSATASKAGPIRHTTPCR